MANINVGDIVERISGKNKGMEVGDQSEVIEVNETTVRLADYDGNHLKVVLKVVNRSGSSATSSKMSSVSKTSVFGGYLYQLGVQP